MWPGSPQRACRPLLWGCSGCCPQGSPATSCAPEVPAALEAQARCANSAAVSGLRAAQLAFLGNHRRFVRKTGNIGAAGVHFDFSCFLFLNSFYLSQSRVLEGYFCTAFSWETPLIPSLLSPLSLGFCPLVHPAQDIPCPLIREPWKHDDVCHFGHELLYCLSPSHLPFSSLFPTPTPRLG